MKHIFRALALVTVLSGAISITRAQTVVAFNFNDQTNLTVTLTASTLSSNLTASTFSVSDGSFTSVPFTTSPAAPDTPAVADSGSWNAASPTKYFSFTITPTSGYAVTITVISFDYRQTASGALNYQVNVGSHTNVTSGAFTRDSTWRQVSDSITLSALTGSNEVRIYGYNGGTGSFGIDRVTVFGTVAAIPEPSAFVAIAGIVALVVAAQKRRHQRSAA